MLAPQYNAASHGNGSGRPSINMSSVFQILHITWGFLRSDLLTFALPNTLFGLLGAIAGPQLLEGPQPRVADVMKRAPFVMLFNFYSLLVFDLANQWSPDSVEEDRVNKPWRPIPSGRITSEQTRKALLFTALVSLAFNYCLGIWSEGLFVQVLSYYYNELNGGGGPLRDVIISVSYGLANRTSLRLASGPENTINQQGQAWIFVVSTIILTTMHIQDMKDLQGDRKRGRKTIPILIGDFSCRIALAILIPFWSIIAVRFWNLGITGSSLYFLLAILVGIRVLAIQDRKEDARTWKLWCFWHTSLYALPILSRV